MAKDPKDLDMLLAATASTDNIELSEKEKLEIEAEAKAEVAKELKAEKRKEFKAAAKQRLKKQVLFQYGKDDSGDDTETVFIQLANFQGDIKLDGKVYYPNRAYRLNKGTAAVIKEMMFRGALHVNETGGKNMAEFYGQRPRGAVISPNAPLPAGFH